MDLKLISIVFAKLTLLVLGFIIIDENFRTVVSFLFQKSFLSEHDFRMLWVVRVIEIGFISLLYHQHLKLFWGKKEHLLKELFWASCLGLVAIVCAFLSREGLWLFGIDLFKVFAPKQPSTAFDFELFFVAILVGPILEEIFFRGVLWNSIQQTLSKTHMRVMGGFLTCLPFVYLHMNMNVPLLDQWMMLGMWFVCAVLTLWLFNWRKSLWMGLSLHGAANFVIYFSHHLVT